MNDRYLFRAKRIDNGELVEGFLIFEKDRAFIAHRVCEVMNSYSKTGEEYGFGNFIEVYPSTICQCTGLKDKSGKLIWENDIVRIVYNGIEYIYKVIWDVSELDFKATNGKENYKSNFQYLTCCEEIEIIENIFDNPELLKE